MRTLIFKERTILNANLFEKEYQKTTVLNEKIKL
ncbi:MAG: Unknown protein [uncultured Aureispira sp.]|uniref:Uncharacterized protein n=1 Tax=uncultured Aureispira sp. TaxID=1331704 RepID=A0A6S6SLT8_9BACT|nr:MAG: Unknown protein [uncultured Aureispira sp.]